MSLKGSTKQGQRLSMDPTQTLELILQPYLQGVHVSERGSHIVGNPKEIVSGTQLNKSH